MFDNSVIQELQNGLMHYFANNEYITQYHAKYIESNKQIINDIQEEIILLSNVRNEGAKNSLDVSSVNIISGKDGNNISNQIVVLSQLREDIKTKQALLKPLFFVQNFAKVNQKEDDIFTWGLFLPNSNKSIQINKENHLIEYCKFRKGILNITAELVQ